MNRAGPLLQAEGLRVREVGPVDLLLQMGECLVLTGASGSGKTLLLRALADLEPHQGELRFNSEPATAFSPAQWRSRVGYLASEAAWWHEMVAPHFPSGYAVPAEALGLPADVTQRPVEGLSTGERQRLALLRLLARTPQVLLLDEPTANLDSESRDAVERLIEDYRRERHTALLWVSHDPTLASRLKARHCRLRGGSLQCN